MQKKKICKILLIFKHEDDIDSSFSVTAMSTTVETHERQQFGLVFCTNLWSGVRDGQE